MKGWGEGFKCLWMFCSKSLPAQTATKFWLPLSPIQDWEGGWGAEGIYCSQPKQYYKGIFGEDKWGRVAAPIESVLLIFLWLALVPSVMPQPRSEVWREISEMPPLTSFELWIPTSAGTDWEQESSPLIRSFPYFQLTNFINVKLIGKGRNKGSLCWVLGCAK